MTVVHEHPVSIPVGQSIAGVEVITHVLPSQQAFVSEQSCPGCAHVVLPPHVP